MGKFTKDRRVLKDYTYSKQVQYFITRYITQHIFKKPNLYNRIFTIEKLRKINIEQDRPISYYRLTIAIDLCAAPGSWSQVLSKKIPQDGKVRIVSVDLQEMAPIEHVVLIQGDITKRNTVETILNKFQYQMADLIVSDGAPDVTGFHDIDQYIQSQLLVAALNICLTTLKEGGIFVAKVFKGSDVKLLYSQFKAFFNQVYFIKPKSSRASSVEYFIICLQYQPRFPLQGFHLYTFQKEIDQEQRFTKEQEKNYKFITCGDLSGFDE